MVGAIFIIIFASTALTDFMVNADVPAKLVAWTQAHVGSKVLFLLAINVILLIVGTVMDIFSAIVVVLPLIGPIAHAYGIDPYHLGVIFLLNLEVGYLHPPVGLNLFITSVKFQRPITEVMWATIPFLVTMIAAQRDFGRRANHRHRRAQLVRRVRHELPLRLERRAKPGHEAVERAREFGDLLGPEADVRHEDASAADEPKVVDDVRRAPSFRGRFVRDETGRRFAPRRASTRRVRRRETGKERCIQHT